MQETKLEERTSGQQSFPFLFSVVSAVYRAEAYLDEMIASLLEQDIGFREHIQLILVDDGSPDRSGEICDRYQKQYPQNIVVLHQKNGGAAAARNAGLAYATGKYINFLDSDDKMTPETFSLVYQFFQKHAEEIDVVAVPIWRFGDRNDSHWLNFKFREGSRVIDLNEEPQMTLMSVSASFFTRQSLQNVRFDTQLVTAEDARLIMQVLYAKQKYGVVAQAKYLYRLDQGGGGSLIQATKDKLAWYMQHLERFPYWAKQYFTPLCGKIPQYAQFVLLTDLSWRFVGSDPSLRFYNPQEHKAYLDMLYACLKWFDDEVILHLHALNTWQRYFILRKKYGREPELVPTAEGTMLQFGQTVYKDILTFPGYVLRADFLPDGQLELHVNVGIPAQDPEEALTVFVELNGKEQTCTQLQVKRLRHILGEVVYRNQVAAFRFTPQPGQQYRVRIGYDFRGQRLVCPLLNYGSYAPLTHMYRHSYCLHQNWLMYHQQDAFLLRPRRRVFSFLRREVPLLWELCTRKKVHNRKAAVVRCLRHVIKPFKRKEIWLVSDRVTLAGDNGEAFFRYLRQQKAEDIRPYFVIQAGCPDYTRMKEIGPVVSCFSWKHKVLFLLADKNLSAHADAYVNNPFRRLPLLQAYYDLVYAQKFIFLQHGVIQNDLSGWLNRYTKNIAMFVTTTQGEYRSILDYDYSYTEQQVKLVGLARHDRLYHDEQKKITIMPTWRKKLTAVTAVGVMHAGEAFCDSDYFQFYNALLNDKRLIAAAAQWGYQLQFMPHPNVIASVDLFDRCDAVQFLNQDMPYRQIFAESNLIVTDYSSVAFDFAYLRKPVIYAQFDVETVYEGQTYDPGYFDYSRDGFGEVEYTLDATVARIIEYMQSGCQLKEKYRKRIEETFPYADRENCARTYAAIRELP